MNKLKPRSDMTVKEAFEEAMKVLEEQIERLEKIVEGIKK